MKRLFLFVSALVFLVPVSLTAQQLKINNAVMFDGVVRVQDVQQADQPLHPAAVRAMARGEKPGAFKNVRYELAPNVRMLTPAQKNSIRLRQDGILDLSGGAFRPSPDSVYLDPVSDLVMQAEPVDDQSMLALRPTLSAVFQDIEVPEQEVPVTLANTVSLAQGVVESSLQLNNKYAVNLQFDSVSFLIDKTDDDSLVVTLVGQILLTNPRVEGKYSKNNGYRLVFLASEQVDMKIYTSMKLKEEAKTPIWGTEIKMSDLGKCEIGLFILTTLEGHVTLAVEIHQGIEMAMGASGGTFWYIPTSIRNISTIDSWCDIDYNITSQMKAFAGFQCTANLKVKGYNALDVYVNGGMEGTVATDGMTLDADVGLRLKAGGKVVSKKFTLIDHYYSLWKYQQPDYHGYSMIIHEACAWGDYVAGEIHSLVPGRAAGVMDTVPYQGSLTVAVDHGGNARDEYSATAGQDGVFVAGNVPLRKGDRVSVRLPGVPNASPAVDVTIPFSEVRLYSADYFTGVASGSVAGSKSKWARMAGAGQGAAPAAASALAGSTAADRYRQVMPQQEVVKRLNEFRNNLIVYRGPIEFITREMPVATFTGRPSTGLSPDGKATAPAGGSKTTGTAQRTTAAGAAAAPSAAAARAAQASASQTAVRQAAGVPSSVPSEAGRISPNRGMVSSPLGLYAVSGLAFAPGQRVKARIEVEGFTVESDWIETEGLMVSAIEHEGFDASVRAGSETFSAANSFVVVSALHGETAPEGTVTLLRGAGAPHASLTMPQQVPEFPDATKAKVWFRKEAPLAPLDGHPGAAVASTGPWSVTYAYSSPGDALNPLKNRHHPFEMVTYVYKGRDLGYSDHTTECASCTAPANIIEKLGMENMPDINEQSSGRPSMQGDKNIPRAKPQQVIKRPSVIR
ncbi:MAG TPA: hypothetical protein PLK17_10400 [Bacteroidales bacterium]|nr:hypothetical protein [Bacteroidales bacterium]